MMNKAEKEKLYEQLRVRAREDAKTIATHLDQTIDVTNVDLAEELLATLRIMNQLGRETGRWK